MNRVICFGAAAALVWASPARASDFVDTRLTFAFSDDNLLVEPGETNPSSPYPLFGYNTRNVLFYENYDTRFSGFETLSHLVLYKDSPSFFGGLSADVALAVLLLEGPTGALSIRDDSSYIRLKYRPPGWGEDERIELVGFPVSADRFRAGYLYRLTWGGTSAYGLASAARATGAPGAKLQITQDRWYAFVGGKTAQLFDQYLREVNTQYGALAGAGVDVLEVLRLEASGGWFQKSVVPALALQDVNAPVRALGGSARAVLHVNEPVSESVDLKLYVNRPDRTEELFRPVSYPGGLSYSVSVEASYLTQTLADPDDFPATVRQPAQALALRAGMKWGFLRTWVLSVYRSLTFIQFDVPSFPPYQDFPEGTEVNPEVFGAIGADYHFPSVRLTPGFSFGVQQPAWFRPPVAIAGGNVDTPGLEAGRTVVVSDVNAFSVLPPDEVALPVYAAKASVRFDFSQHISTSGEVFWLRDPNRVTFVDDVTGVAQQVFQKEDGVGFNVLVNARF